VTAYQFGTMKFINTYDIAVMKELRQLNMNTIRSLLVRGWIDKKNGYLILTVKGLQEYEKYIHSAPNYRKIEKDVSPIVRSLLYMLE
jgi:hypothetical protein